MRRTRTPRRLVAATCLVVLAAGVPAARASVHGGHGRVTPSGRIGPLRIDRSGLTHVRRFAGRPDVEQASGTFGAPSDPRYHALGYGCSDTFRPQLESVGRAFCRTVFYVNRRTRRLVAFWSSSPAYRGPAGIRPGMSAARAERRSRHHAFAGCLSGMSFHTAAAWLFADVRGGRITHTTPPRIAGGTVVDFALESTRHPVGLLFC
jgi:hypothetical protein